MEAKSIYMYGSAYFHSRKILVREIYSFARFTRYRTVTKHPDSLTVFTIFFLLNMVTQHSNLLFFDCKVNETIAHKLALRMYT